LGAVAVIAVGFTYLAHTIGGTRDLATPVFLISGTLVALILPAASLSAQYLEVRLTYWGARLANAKPEDTVSIQGQGHDEILHMESLVEPLWRGFLFIAVSLPLSALALVRLDLHIGDFSAEELLVGMSVGLVLVAVFAFLPFTWEILQLHLARATRAALFAAVVAAPPPPDPREGQAGS
jgi:hypothetical protein